MLFALLSLFAQIQPRPPRPPGPPPEVAAAAAAGFGVFMIIWLVVIIFSLLLAAVGLTIAILDLMACYKALNTVRKRNRTMEPGMVFLIFVPFLNIVWAFLNVMRVAESLRSEFEDRGWNTDDESFGYGLGLTAAILNLIPCAAPIGLVFLYMHWRQVSAYTEQLLVNKRPR